MTLAGITASSRIAIGGAEPEGVYGVVYLDLAKGLRDATPFNADGQYSQAAFRLGPGPVTSGLLTCIGPPTVDHVPTDDDPYVGVRCDGEGDVVVDFYLNPIGVWTGPDSGFDITIEGALRLNGAIVHRFSGGTFHSASWVSAFTANLPYISPPLAVVAGDVIDVGLIFSRNPVIGSYSAGTGAGTHLTVFGTLTRAGAIPGFKIRGSVDVGAAL